MNKNYLTQVVILFLLTIGILLGLSTLKSTDINFTTKEIDILGSLRDAPANEELPGDDNEEQPLAGSDSTLAKDPTAVTGEEAQTDVESTIAAPDSVGHTAGKVPAAAADSIFARIDVSNVKRKAGDITLIEDYTAAQAGLKNLKAAIDGNEQFRDYHGIPDAVRSENHR